MPAQLIQFSWANETTPQLEFATAQGLEAKKIAFDMPLSLQVMGGPNCVGFWKNGKWTPCPYGHTGVRKCEDCKQKEGFGIEQFCDGYNLELFTPEDIERLNAPHYVYLALFQRDLIKVGVSNLSRGFLRQIEQGSHFTLVLAEGLNGILARQLETALRRSGIPDKISLAQKKELIFPDVSSEEGHDLLLQTAARFLPSVLFDRPDFKKFIPGEFPFHDFSAHYHLESGALSPQPFHPVTLTPGESVSGKVLTVKGSFFVIETDVEKVLLSAKELIGFILENQETPFGLRINSAFQGALF